MLHNKGMFSSKWLLATFATLTIALAGAPGCASSSDPTDLTPDEIVAEETFLKNAPPAKAAAGVLTKSIDDSNEVDARFSKEMARVGPMLKPQEIEGFGKAFENLEDVRAVRKAYLEAAEGLDSSLGALVDDKAALARALNGIKETTGGGRGGPITTVVYGPNDVYEAMRLLSTTQFAGRSMMFAQRLMAKDPALAKIDKTPDEAFKELWAPAAAHALLGHLITKGNATDGLAAFKEQLKSANELGGATGELLEKIHERQGIEASLATVQTKIKPALSSLTMVLAIWEAGEVVDAVRQGHWKEALQEAINGAGTIKDGLSTAMTVYRSISKTTTSATLGASKLGGNKVLAFAASFGKVASKIFAGVGVVISVINLAKDISEWGNSAADKVEVLASALGVVSGVLVLIGVGGPVGAVIAVLSIGFQLFAGFLRDRAEERLQTTEITKCLTTLKLDPTLLNTMAHARAETFGELRKQANFGQPEFRWLAEQLPAAILRDSMLTVGINYNSIGWYQELFKLTPADTLGVLKATAAKNPDAADRERVRLYLLRVGDNSWAPGLSVNPTRAQMLKFIDEDIAQERRVNFKTGLQDARAYLAAH
jgi:hypothetical protein